MCIQKGDLEAGFAESDHVLEGEIRTGGQVIKFSFKVYNNVEKKKYVFEVGTSCMARYYVPNTYFCVAYTRCKPRNAIAEDIYSCICHGEQSGCHVVFYRRR